MADAPEKARRRWFRLTPDRCVLGLLALESLLLLSGRFGRIAFNHHKGWTMLIAAASVGVAVLLMFLWFLAALVFRWRFQFSIGSLLLLPVVVAILCGWLAVERQRARKQRETVTAIRSLGGYVTYDYMASGAVIGPLAPPGPAWMRRLLGVDFFADVVEAGYRGPFITNSALGSVPITDAWLEHIGKLPRLEVLDLAYSRVTDGGLRELRGLTHLRKLNVASTLITDAGVEPIAKLAGLEVLNLDCTHVSDAGVEKLEGLNAPPGVGPPVDRDHGRRPEAHRKAARP